jgi:hypothetical protein
VKSQQYYTDLCVILKTLTPYWTNNRTMGHQKRSLSAAAKTHASCFHNQQLKRRFVGTNKTIEEEHNTIMSKVMDAMKEVELKSE